MWIAVGMMVGALGLDALLGDPRSGYHPVALFGAAARKMEAFCRAHFGNGIAAGLIGWVILTMGTALVAGISVYFAWREGVWLGLCWTVFWLYLTIALRSLCEHAGAIAKSLLLGDLDAARAALARIVSRDTASLNESEIVRGGVESLGENLIDAVFSPLFWASVGFVLGGLPGAAFAAVWLRAANTLDAMWGYRNERYLLFGRVAARMDDFAHYLSARLGLVAIALAAPAVRGAVRQTWRIGWRHRHDHPSPNSCFGMAGFAGALGIRLGGPTVYGGVTENYPYWGDGRAELQRRDLRRAQILVVVSTVIFSVMMLLGVAVWRILFI